MTTKQKCDNLLRTWINNADPDGEYKLTGVYWEVLYPVLKEHSPELLKEYGDMVGDFNYFNEEVRQKLTTGNDEKDFRNAVEYMNAREKNFGTPLERDYIDLGNDNIISYIPNQNLDGEKDFENL